MHGHLVRLPAQNRSDAITAHILPSLRFVPVGGMDSGIHILNLACNRQQSPLFSRKGLRSPGYTSVTTSRSCAGCPEFVGSAAGPGLCNFSA